ncbi:MAG: TonB-dependent receptor [Bacteroidia bacterium]|nr:TonB-dependent receptor [Bacteroidia bacterium]MCZ2276745.1 TonB-dependent receptor [Bacteroidia bacterium]
MQKLCLLIFCLIIAKSASPQHTITGTVRDYNNGEPLFGANIILKGTTHGAVTDFDGRFIIKTLELTPVTLQVSYIGYILQEITIRNFSPVIIRMKPDKVMLSSVEISGSRISDKQKEAPMTVEAMDMIGIKETPATGFYEGLGNMKGIDLTAASMGFKIINTRGFNSSSPVRSLQLIDGVDNQSPGLNFSLGNFLGASELDVQKVEIIQGASSALYGPNAFNGVISMTTRSPFINPGLEVSFKVGERELVETAFRWAEYFKNKKGEPKFGYKLNMYFMQAQDWEADNLAATPQSRDDIRNPGGYDAVNIYGDEYKNGYDFNSNAAVLPGLGTIYRKGYHENELVDYNSKNAKIGTAFYYKIKNDVEAIAASNFGTGTTIYQGDNRYSLKDILFFQNRLEIKKEDRWFIRAYSTHEDAGKSYDAFFTALLLQRSAKPDRNFTVDYWQQDYVNYWQSSVVTKLKNLPGFPSQPPPSCIGPCYTEWIASINQFLTNNYYDTLVYYHSLAAAYANGVGNPLNAANPFYLPGTYEFDTAFAAITSRKTFGEGGSRFFDRSALYHIQGEYKFVPSWAEIVIGGNFRWYRPYSQGTIFSDTTYIHYSLQGNDTIAEERQVKITNRESGIYTGIEKRIMDDKLRFSLTARVDKNENFNYLFSPAASVVYVPDKNHLVRTSFSSAIRNPTLTDQYLYYQVGRAILIGNKDGFNDLVTIPSLTKFFDLNKNFDSLSFFNVKAVRPEQVKTLEAGYRSTLFKNLYVDFGGYFSWYKNFIGYKFGADVDTFTVHSIFGDFKDLRFNNILRVATNSEDQVVTMGFNAGLNYFLGKYFTLSANYSWNRLDRQGSEDPLIPAYNTPEHKFNIGFSGRDIKNWGFSLNFKWIDGYLFEGSPQFSGFIDSYSMLDVQASRYIPSVFSTFKIGASNLLNNKHYEIFGGPLVGRLVYFSILTELNEKKLSQAQKSQH